MLDAVGSQRTAILAELDAAAIFFAGTRPERTSALILVHTSAKGVASHDYPIGFAEVAEALLAQFDQLWGTDAASRDVRAQPRRGCAVPPLVREGAADQPEPQGRPAVRPRHVGSTCAPSCRWSRRQPSSCTDETSNPSRSSRGATWPSTSPRRGWSSCQEPTRRWPGRPRLALDLIQQFLTGVHRPVEPNRVLATVLFSDIVASTEQASQLGDRRWRELLNVHDELARRLVEEFSGRLVKMTGDGLLATFDGPGRGSAARPPSETSWAASASSFGWNLHTGEVELRDGDVGGIAVHIAARVMAAAGPGEILTSRTVQDLIVAPTSSR